MSTGPRLFLNLSVSITGGIWPILAITPSSTTLCDGAVYTLNARAPGHRIAEFAATMCLLLCVYLAHALALFSGGAMSGKGPFVLTHKASCSGLTLNGVARQQRWWREHRFVLCPAKILGLYVLSRWPGMLRVPAPLCRVGHLLS